MNETHRRPGHAIALVRNTMFVMDDNNPYKPPSNPAIQGRTVGPKTLLCGIRAICAATGLLGWFAASMWGMSANTSWEHHPFGGVFVLLKQSRSLVDYSVSIFALALVLTVLVLWVVKGKSWLAAVAIAAALASIAFSLFAAKAAVA